MSFIRQFNLYDFKKKHDVFLDLDGKGVMIRFGLYYHQYLRSGVQDLLQRCARKVVKRVHLTGNAGIKRHELEMEEDLDHFQV